MTFFILKITAENRGSSPTRKNLTKYLLIEVQFVIISQNFDELPHNHINCMKVLQYNG